MNSEQQWRCSRSAAAAAAVDDVVCTAAAAAAVSPGLAVDAVDVTDCVDAILLSEVREQADGPLLFYSENNLNQNHKRLHAIAFRQDLIL